MKRVLATAVILGATIGSGVGAYKVIAGGDPASDPRNHFVGISRKMIPSVVNIFTTSSVQNTWRGGRMPPGPPSDEFRDFFEKFFRQEPNGGVPEAPEDHGDKAFSLGSGFILEATGNTAIIVTNNHVIDGADEVLVKFTEEAKEKETKAEIVGADPDLDVAVLKVKTTRKLQAVTLGNSDRLEVGEWVAAIGIPFGHGHSVTHGIVSAKERILPLGFGKYIQVDAPINPGNSGGPLVNIEGEVVGINNAIDERGPGIGFAIPISQAKIVIDQLKTKGHVDRGYVGVTVDDLRPDLAKNLNLDENLVAPIVTHIVPGQPADKAGLQVYDVVIEVNGKEVQTPGDLVTEITNVPIGSKVKMKVLRGKKTLSLDVAVVRRPEQRGERSRSKQDKKKKFKKAPKVSTGMTIEQIDGEISRELSLPDNYKGVVVTQVMQGSPAYNAGLDRGDVILEVDRKAVKTEDDFYRLVKEKKTYLLRIRRQDQEGEETFFVVTLKLGSQED